MVFARVDEVMQSRIPTIAREDVAEPVDESTTEDSDGEGDARDDEKSLDEIIDVYSE